MKTVTVKTAELEGAALDWAVGKAQPLGCIDPSTVGFSPSEDWRHGGPILEAYIKHVEYHDCSMPFVFWASNDRHGELGETLLIAAMRAIVASELGDTVEIPEELV